jgi:hypothetical protein
VLFVLISQHVTIFIFLSRLRLGDPSGPAVIWTATSIHFHVRTISYMFFARSLNQCDFSIAVASLPAQLTEESWWHKDGHCVVTCFFLFVDSMPLKLHIEVTRGDKAQNSARAATQEVHEVPWAVPSPTGRSAFRVPRGQCVAAWWFSSTTFTLT